MPTERHAVAFEETVGTVAELGMGQMWDRMLGEFLGEWGRLDRTGISDAEMDREMQAFMDGLSDKPLEELSRKSAGVSYNQGRSAEILSSSAEFVVRSEILDGNTCANCSTLDGQVVQVGSTDYHMWLPPAGCLGGDNCRGFYVPIGGEA